MIDILILLLILWVVINMFISLGLLLDGKSPKDIIHWLFSNRNLFGKIISMIVLVFLLPTFGIYIIYGVFIHICILFMIIWDAGKKEK